MFELWSYDEYGEDMMMTFATEEELRQYADEYELWGGDSEGGYFGRTPEGEEFSL